MNTLLTDLTLHEAAEALKRREVSAIELTQAHLERIAAVDPLLNSYLTLDEPGALAQAAASDKRLAAGNEIRPLEGCPIALKDNFVTRGLRTTCASRILDSFIPPYDSGPTERLKEAGTVLLGKLNMDEFAMGGSSETSAYGPVRNPYDLDRVPGGSSGGSATALAARLTLGALGTDTGGSIRQPAAFCGVVGLRPTYGRVSRYGVVAYASSLDQAGPMARTVRDTALLLQAIAGHDPRDSTSSLEPVPDFTAALGQDPAGLKVGIPRNYFGEGLDPEIRAAIQIAQSELENLGVELIDIDLPHTDYAVPCYYIIAPAEASSNLARYDGVRYGHRSPNARNLLDLYQLSRSEGFGDEVKRRIMLGTYCLSAGYYDAYYKKAMQVRTLIRQDFINAFKQVDAVLAPVSPFPAFRLGEKLDDPLAMYLADIYTVPTNLAGLPGLALPCGFTKAGLPIGLQLIGRPFDESGLLALGHAYEQATAWHKRRPEVGDGV